MFWFQYPPLQAKQKILPQIQNKHKTFLWVWKTHHFLSPLPEKEKKMQRLLSLKQLASKSNFLKNPTNFTFSKPFTCHPNVQKRPLSSFSKHPFHPTFSWRSQQSLSLKTHAFLFNPLLARRFFTSLLSSQLRKSFFDGKVLFFRAQFPERSFASFRYRW